MLTGKIILLIIILWILLEISIRSIAEKGLKTDFYGSISEDKARELQQFFGLKLSQGNGWMHLGWIADPKNETYKVEKRDGQGNWGMVGEAIYGSWLGNDLPGDYRVLSISKTEKKISQIGEVHNTSATQTHVVENELIPSIAGEWHYLFKPQAAGDYLNDHCLFTDKNGNWRILGITSHSKGDYSKERTFAVGVGDCFPPRDNYREEVPIAGGNDLAWAPYVIKEGDTYHLFWSPHKLHHMTSADGINWACQPIVMDKPFHKFFRDAMIYEVAPKQWLMYATGRGKWFSRIDLYQSFDLEHWQYIGPAINSSWGSEKNFVSGSMESPFLINREGQYYLSLTYNNETFCLSAILLQFKIFLNRKAYNNTLLFKADSPYDFGVYRGTKKTPALLTRLQCHAPVYIKEKEDWYLTTCGWPFAATLTRGEVAYAKLTWKESNGRKSFVNKS